MQRLRWPLAALAMAATLAATRPVAAAEADPGDVALAQRVAENARAILSGKVITPAHFKMSAAMLEAARRLDPVEPRYPRLLADAMLQARDSDGALKALKAYVALEPYDKGALLQLTDLYANAFQTEDKRLDYLRDWVDDARLPEEVRSHIAWRAFQAYSERSQTIKAKGMLDLSLKLNPLNLEALKSRYALVVDGTPFERIATLLAMLQSNPAQVPVVTNLAQELAALGLAQPSAEVYSRAFAIAQKAGVGVPREMALNFAVELILINQLAPAKTLLDNLSKADPNDYETLVVRLLVERGAEPKDDAQKKAVAATMQQIQNVLLNRLQGIRKSLGDSSATTRPVESTAPVDFGSLADDLRKFKDLKPEVVEPVRRAYVDMAGETAWFLIYFAESPADAKPFIDALKELLTDNSPLLARLEGWSFLVRRENDAANVKLSAVKEKDPLAELGLVKMMDGDAAQKEGIKLLAKQPSGLTSVVILDALRDRKVVLTPPDTTAPVMELLNKFPKDWFSVLDQPQRFYVLKAEPLKMAHAFGEAMFVRVTITNISEFPITIGDDGLIHPDLWFDAQFRGLAPQVVPGAAYDRMRREIVLKPRGSVSQLIRVDQGAIAKILSDSPFPAMQIILQVRTNPSPSGVGPGGQAVQATKFIERSAFPLSSASTLDTVFATAGPAEKLRLLDFALGTAVVLSQQQGNAPAQELAQKLGQLIQSALRDSSPSVQTWSATLLARATGAQERQVFIGRMMGDPQWCTRLMALSSLAPLSLADQKAIAAKGAKDTDPTVVAFATALGELLDMVQAGTVPPPATNPTTAPATAPSIGPATAPAPKPPVASGPPTSGPASRPTGTSPDLVIPSLPLVLPPTTEPATKPAPSPN